MAEAKLAPNLPDWMVEHANLYRSSGGTDGHMYKDAAWSAGDDRSVVAADDEGAEVGREVRISAVLWEGRRQLFRGGLQRRSPAASRMVPQHPG